MTLSGHHLIVSGDCIELRSPGASVYLESRVPTVDHCTEVTNYSSYTNHTTIAKLC